MKPLQLIAPALFALALSLPVHAETRDDHFIRIDGSSTVYPITEAVAEEFGTQSPQTKVTVGISGTGGGFKKFCAGETDLSDASRPIKDKEISICKEKNINYVELPVAYDALSVVVHPQNTWAESMTTAELKKLWEPAAQGKITHWNQIRAEWPNKKIYLFGPGIDSGTFDYFTEVIVGENGASRGDFTSSEDDNVLVQGVANNKFSLGFFGLAYYIENQSRLKAVKVDDMNAANGDGPQEPSMQNVLKGVYQPLARPLFVYASLNSLTTKPTVKKFMHFYLENAEKLSEEVGYIPAPKDIQQLTMARFQKQIPGTIFGSNSGHGKTLAQLLEMGAK